jgi:hypothetical protein
VKALNTVPQWFLRREDCLQGVCYLPGVVEVRGQVVVSERFYRLATDSTH